MVDNNTDYNRVKVHGDIRTITGSLSTLKELWVTSTTTNPKGSTVIIPEVVKVTPGSGDTMISFDAIPGMGTITPVYTNGVVGKSIIVKILDTPVQGIGDIITAAGDLDGADKDALEVLRDAVMGYVAEVRAAKDDVVDSAARARDDADKAADAATRADGSATRAQESADNAATRSLQAATSADAARESATSAGDSATTATDAAGRAESDATSAQEAAISAGDSAMKANDAARLAQSWSGEEVDTDRLSQELRDRLDTVDASLNVITQGTPATTVEDSTVELIEHNHLSRDITDRIVPNHTKRMIRDGDDTYRDKIIATDRNGLVRLRRETTLLIDEQNFGREIATVNDTKAIDEKVIDTNRNMAAIDRKVTGITASSKPNYDYALYRNRVTTTIGQTLNRWDVPLNNASVVVVPQAGGLSVTRNASGFFVSHGVYRVTVFSKSQGDGIKNLFINIQARDIEGDYTGTPTVKVGNGLLNYNDNPHASMIVNSVGTTTGVNIWIDSKGGVLSSSVTSNGEKQRFVIETLVEKLV